MSNPTRSIDGRLVVPLVRQLTNFRQTVTQSPSVRRWTRLGAISVLLGATLTVQGFTVTTQLDQINTRKTLNIATVAGDSTFFAHDRYMHGFGYDLARNLADQFKVRLNFKRSPSALAALTAVQQGRADIALTTAKPAQIQALGLSALSVACTNADSLSAEGLNPQLTWAVRDATDALYEQLNTTVCTPSQVSFTQSVARFYSQRLARSSVFHSNFNKILTARLPMYKSAFQLNAKAQRVDWHLLAAMSYQESHLEPTAISPTGVSGIMMLTQATASDMGVVDRNDPVESIRGGAQYLQRMQRQYASVPNPDRLWFSLAAYNMGPAAVDNVRSAVAREGGNRNSWAATYAWLDKNQAHHSRYSQCMHYVSHIRSYVETFKQDGRLARI